MNTSDIQAESWLLQQAKEIEADLKAAKMTPEKAEKLLAEIRARYDASALVTSATYGDAKMVNDILSVKELHPRTGMTQKKFGRLAQIESAAASLQQEIGFRIAGFERRTDRFWPLSVKVSELRKLLIDLSDGIEADLFPGVTDKELPEAIHAMRRKAESLRLYLAAKTTDGFLPIRGTICLEAELGGGFDKILILLRNRQYHRHDAEVDELSRRRDAVIDHLKDARKPKWIDAPMPSDLVNKPSHGAAQPVIPTDIISSDVAITEYNVSRPTIRRAVKEGRLKDYRPEHCADNSPFQLSRAEVRSHWRKRGQ